MRKKQLEILNRINITEINFNNFNNFNLIEFIEPTIIYSSHDNDYEVELIELRKKIIEKKRFEFELNLFKLFINKL